MEYLGMNIVQHPSLPADDVWIIYEKEAPQVPEDLGGDLAVPFILTGDTERAKHLLSFVGLINGTGKTVSKSRGGSL
jgi:hypothetical protein